MHLSSVRIIGAKLLEGLTYCESSLESKDHDYDEYVDPEDEDEWSPSAYYDTYLENEEHVYDDM